MVSRLLPRLLAACALVLLTTAPPPAAAGAKLAQRLEQGEIVVTAERVDGSKLPGFRMMGVVNAPVDAVWGILRRCEDWAGKMPRVQRSNLVSRSGGKQRCKIRVELPFPLGHLDSVTEGRSSRSGEGYQYRWHLLSGDYDHHRGEWKLLPFGSDKARTLVVYAAHVVPRVAVPDSMLSDGQKKELPAIIESLREQTRVASR